MALPVSSALTASWVGTMGVRLARTRNVARADSSASTTAPTPRRRAQRPGAAAEAIIGSAAATWPTFVITRNRNLDVDMLQQSNDRGYPRCRREAFIQQCCWIATIPGRYPATESSVGPEYLDIQVPDFLT